MVREIRDVSLLVVRCHGALEMPDTIRHRDELVRRYALTAVKPPRPVRHLAPDGDIELESEPGSLLTAVDDEDLPFYF